MHWCKLASLSTTTVLGLALLSGDALAQQKSVKDQLVGTWTLVSTIDVHPDGRKIDRYGPNVRGILMFDTSGRYAQFITRPDLPKFAAGTVDKGTPEEMRAVLESFVGGFGTYSVNEAEKTLLTRVEGNVFPNVVGVEQKRIILSLTADELKYTNPATTRGIGAEATWRRVI